MSGVIQKFSKIFFGTFDQTALLSGTSDIIVVKWDSGQYHSTPFLVCFGMAAITAKKHKVRVYINKILLSNVHFNIDSYGYLHPMRPTPQFIKSLQLKHGKNSITFELDNSQTISCQIYMYNQDDKLLVSDMDGTLTKDDLGGLYSNYHGENYLHEGYYQLIEALHKRKIKIVWLTMRSLPLYSFSKNYIEKHTQIDGPLITQPEQFFTAMKKQVLKKTGGVKANMLRSIKNLFPENCNPFVGGLGNRENDAIAYRAVGIPLNNIFIVNTTSQVYKFTDQKIVTYHQMSKNLTAYFLLPQLHLKKTQTYSQYYSKLTQKTSSSFKSKFHGQVQ